MCSMSHGRRSKPQQGVPASCLAPARRLEKSFFLRGGVQQCFGHEAVVGGRAWYNCVSAQQDMGASAEDWPQRWSSRGRRRRAGGWVGRVSRCGGAEGNRDQKAHCFCKVQGTSWTARAAHFHPPSQRCFFYAEIKKEKDFPSLESAFLWAYLDEDISTTQTLIEVFDFTFVCGVNLYDN